MNLLLLDFNNYFNRTIKKYSTVDDYKTNSSNFAYQLNVNFIPNDGITTEQIINFNASWEPNYVVCFDEYNNIKSRWFIIESVRTRNGQFKLSLKRDSIVDNWNAVITAPCFIEKGTVGNINDFAIYNSEGMQFNQIKKSETLLKDNSLKGWLVGYFSPDQGDKPIDVPATSVDYIYADDRDSWEYHQYETTDYKYIADQNIKVDVAFPQKSNYRISVFDNSYEDYGTTGIPNAIVYNATSLSILQSVGSLTQYAYQLRTNMFNAWLATQSDYKNTDPLTSLNGKYIYFNAQAKFYQISVSVVYHYDTVSPTKGSAAEIAINNTLTGFNKYGMEYDYPYSGLGAVANTKVYIDARYIKITLTEVSLTAYNTNIHATAKRLTDAPYKMFAIPYGAVGVMDLNGGVIWYTLEEKEALNVACSIAKELGTALYDLQLLPYCPMPDILDANELMLIGAETGKDFEYITYTDPSTQVTTNVGVMLYCRYSSFTFDISKTISAPTNVNDFKIENETKLYRLMSPNGSANFDFKITKTGSITKFNVDCTYKPYTPYIHINPVWSKDRLYGGDFNDYRGLICQGDFSVATLNDQWKQYQINNKNYLNAFNRETDSLELNYKYQKLGNILGAGTSALGAGIGAGAITGNAALGVGAGVASLVGGIADVGIADKLHQEQMDLRKDQFDYSIKNIQARPQTIARSSALDANNKIFPVLEEYDCSLLEKRMLNDKMLYEGMTINRIDFIANFLYTTETYIRGNIIKIDNIVGDYHMLEDIKKEISYGIRAKE